MSDLIIAPLTPGESYAALLPTCADWTLFHTSEWLAFLDEVVGGQRLELAIRRQGNLIGLLPARTVRVGPLRIFASPMPGWSTEYMGPAWREAAPQGEFFEALGTFLRYGRFIHAETSAPPPGFAEQPGWTIERAVTYVAELVPDRESMMRTFSKSCRKAIRRAEQRGVKVAFTEDERFIDIYYSQLQEVFGKRNLRPTYPVERVRALWRHLRPAGRLLTSWATSDGQIIATRIDMVGNGRLHSFGSASRQATLSLVPNEILRFFVMAWAAEHGLTRYDMSGGGYYKKKFGAELVQIVHLIRSPGWLRASRSMARKWIYWRKRGRAGANSQATGDEQVSADDQ